jgi:phosphoribosylformylglycinamidine cyclo-ligase
MYRTFNMGVGLCAVVPASDTAKALAALEAVGQPATRIGTIVAGAAGAEADVTLEPGLAE